MKPRHSHELTIELSWQTYDLLDQLTSYGIYGSSLEEVARRMVDEGVGRFVEMPRLKVRGEGA